MRNDRRRNISTVEGGGIYKATKEAADPQRKSPEIAPPQKIIASETAELDPTSPSPSASTDQ